MFRPTAGHSPGSSGEELAKIMTEREWSDTPSERLSPESVAACRWITTGLSRSIELVETVEEFDIDWWGFMQARF